MWWTYERLVALGATIVAAVFAFLFFAQRGETARALAVAEAATEVSRQYVVEFRDQNDSIRKGVRLLRDAQGLGKAEAP